MKNTNLLMNRLAFLAFVSMGIGGCASSAPKADLPANANPNEEISKLKMEISNGDANDYAVLDQKDFNESKDHLRKAEDKMRDNKNPSDVLAEVSTSRAYFNRTQKIALDRRGHIDTILDSRAQAVSAGALQYPQSRKELENVDEDARTLAESNDVPAADKISKTQRRYGEVQLSALETQQLGNAKGMIDAADSRGAKSKAPKTLNQAKVDYANAKMAISMNRSNASAYMPAVKQANLSADTLARVMDMAQKNDKNFNEDEAVKIVMQERAIHSLDNQVDSQEAQKSALQDKLMNERDTLNAKNADLKESNKKVAMQKALQQAQDEFSSNEAEVYQKDNSLLILSLIHI